MAVRIEHYSDPDGVAIERGDGRKPIFVLPFPKDRFYRAEPLDDDTVLFIGGVTESGRSWNTLLLAVYDLRLGRFVGRAEVAGVTVYYHLLSRDRSCLFVAGPGIAVVDCRTLKLVRRLDCYKLEGETGRAAAYADWPGGGQEARQAGWTHLVVQRHYAFGETEDGSLMVMEQAHAPLSTDRLSLEQTAVTIDPRSGTVRVRVLLRADGTGPLGLVDPWAELAFVSSRQTAVFWAVTPSPDMANVEGVWHPGGAAAERAGDDERCYGLPLHVWRLAEADASPMTVVVRSEPVSRWAPAVGVGFPSAADITLRYPTVRMLDDVMSGADRTGDVHWALAARAFVYQIYENRRDGTIWIAFSDACLRSLDASGKLGPLIQLAGKPSRTGRPNLTFADDGTLTVWREGQVRSSLRYCFDPGQFDGVAGPVSVEPSESVVDPERHAKAFTAFVRRQTRKRFAVPDWTRESCAAALGKQARALRIGFADMVVASTESLNFTYRVGKTTLDEASFFAGLAEREMPVVPELRVLLAVYLQALGEGGEGVQPWEDPDEGVGALGSALRALAILDPNALDIVRSYMDKRDGEHEGYCWSAVLPAYFDRHGWRDAATVRFGVYAVLNRFWGGAHPSDLNGLPAAMRDLTTPADVAQTVRREADTFGQKPEWGYDAAAYRTAFCATLDPNVTFDRVVLGELQQREMLQNS